MTGSKIKIKSNITSKKSKIKSNIISKNSKSKSIQNDIKTWGKNGSVFSYAKKHYMTLGTTVSFNVIKNELIGNKIWLKFVKSMSKIPSSFENKFKSLLQ
jgi:hypothetical protein